MDYLNTRFVSCLLNLRLDDQYDIEFGAGSLVYDTRNDFIQKAIDGGYGRILWFDSDMTFDAATIAYLEEDLERGYDIVAGLAFKRRKPYTPVIFQTLELDKTDEGLIIPKAEVFTDYPKDCLFEVAGFGFGAVAMTMDGLKRVVDKYGPKLFMPYAGFGEDLTFCLRAKMAGEKLYCDSRAEVGHIGEFVYDSAFYEDTRKC